MQIEYWFPTITAKHHTSDAVRMATQDRIENWIQRGDHVSYLELCKEDNLHTSYFRHHDTLADLQLHELHAEILSCAVSYAQAMGLHIHADMLRVDSWINFFEPGQHEQQHNHYGNFLSGTYYVSGGRQSGCYRFFDPAAQKTMWKGIYLKGSQPGVTNMSQGEYHPEPGLLIMFPSWLEHAVMTNKSDQTRISIAFNINPKHGISI